MTEQEILKKYIAVCALCIYYTKKNLAFPCVYQLFLLPLRYRNQNRSYDYG